MQGNWGTAELVSETPVPMPPGMPQNFDLVNGKADLYPPLGFRHVSEDGRFVVALYGTGARTMGADVPKIMALSFADGQTLDLGIPRLVEVGSGRYRIVAEDRGTPVSHGFTEPYPEVDKPSYRLAAVVDPKHAVYEYTMYRGPTRRRFGAVALVTFAGVHRGESVTLEDPLKHQQRPDGSFQGRIQADWLERSEFEVHEPWICVYRVTYRWTERRATPKLVVRIPTRYRGFELHVTAADVRGPVLLEGNKPRVSGQFIRRHGEMSELPEGRFWQMWRGRVVSFKKGNFEEFSHGAVRSLAKGYEFLASNLDGRWMLVRHLDSGKLYRLRFN